MFRLYSLILGFGSTIGLAWTAWRAPLQKVTNLTVAAFLCLVGILIGARAGFVIANWNYFQPHWNEIPQFWLGGLTGTGGILGGIISLVGIARFRKEQLGSLADGLMPMIVALTATAWLASWEAGVAYGPLNAHGWWAVPALDESGALALRWPVQLLGAVLSLVIFGIIDRFRPHYSQPGKASSLVITGLAATWLGLSFLRADPIRSWMGWRLDTWIYLVMLLISIGICLITFLYHKEMTIVKIEELPSGQL
jgi:phosphatidylglycerol---prolipoprotein diacylglyceryl transferase